MKFEGSQFFVSYTQKGGVFLDNQLRKKLAIEEGDTIEMTLIVKDESCRVTYATARSKEKWNYELEKQAYGNVWYSYPLEDKSLIIMGYVDWNNLVFDWEIKNLLNTNFCIEIKKYSEIKPCKSLTLKITSALPTSTKSAKKADLLFEIPDVVSEKSETRLWFYTKDSEKKPINFRRIGLERLPSLGVERKTALNNKGINTIIQLISYPVDELKKIKGISFNLITKWILAASKVFVPSAFPVTCQIFLTDPRGQKLLVNETTQIKVLEPYYSQFFVRGHPRIESRLLHELQASFKAFYNINMKQENTLTLTSKDGEKEINIFGPWIVEMIGFETKDKVEETLEELKICIESAFEAWDEKDVVLLISPQETSIEADEVLNALVNKLAVQYSQPEQILWQIRWGKKIIVDSNVLVDGRLSSLIMRTMTDIEEYRSSSPEIIVPNIVTYEIKSMLDRANAKNAQSSLADIELQRLRALSDAGYIKIKYTGEIPQMPPVTQYEKGIWKFYSSLRDEYILKILEQTENATLLTQDGRLATSAYVKGFEVIHIKPILKALKDEYEQEIKSLSIASIDEQDRILSEIADDLMVSSSTLKAIIRMHSLVKMSQ